MVLGVIMLGIVAGLTSGAAALIAGYSILMALWFYTLAGCLAVTGGLLFVNTIQILAPLRNRQHAYGNSSIATSQR